MAAKTFVDHITACNATASPQLATLLEALKSRVLAQDGSAALRVDEDDANAAAEELHRERLAYLEATVLHTEARSLVEEGDEKLQRVRELLDGATCAQLLRLPPSDNPDAPEAHSQVLGLKPSDVYQPAAPGELAQMIPLVEARLVEKCQLIGRLLAAHPTPPECSSRWRGDEVAGAAVAEVRAFVAALRRGSEPARLVGYLQGQASRLLGLLVRLFQMIHETVHLYTTLLREHKLKKQHERNLVVADALVAQYEATHAKLQQIQHLVLSHTYTDQTVPALQAVHSHLVSAGEDLLGVYESTSASLREYASVDADFDQLAAEYGEVKQELQHCEGVLRELRRDMEAPPAA